MFGIRRPTALECYCKGPGKTIEEHIELLRQHHAFLLKAGALAKVKNCVTVTVIGFVVAVIESRLHVRPAHMLTDRDRFALKVYQRPILEYWRELQETAGIKPEANDSRSDLGSPAITHFKPGRIRWQPVLYSPTH